MPRERTAWLMVSYARQAELANLDLDGERVERREKRGAPQDKRKKDKDKKKKKKKKNYEKRKEVRLARRAAPKANGDGRWKPVTNASWQSYVKCMRRRRRKRRSRSVDNLEPLVVLRRHDRVAVSATSKNCLVLDLEI